MKSLLLPLAILSIIITSCTTSSVGPEGPPGQEGPVGPEGAQGESAFVFEYTDVDFTTPDYEVVLPYPDDFEGIASDVLLVYLLWEVTTDSDGNNVEIWRQMPQTVYTEMGQIQYNFDFTIFDVRLFMTTEFDAELLKPIDTDDWIVRAVIVPGNFWGSRSSIDHSDYFAVKEAYGLPELTQKSLVQRR